MKCQSKMNYSQEDYEFNNVYDSDSDELYAQADSSCWYN